MFFVYVLQSVPTGRYYIGSTRDVMIRLTQHNSGKTASTRNYRPWKLVHTEELPTPREARQKEFQIKAWKNREYMVRTLGLDT